MLGLCGLDKRTLVVLTIDAFSLSHTLGLIIVEGRFVGAGPVDVSRDTRAVTSVDKGTGFDVVWTIEYEEEPTLVPVEL